MIAPIRRAEGATAAPPALQGQGHLGAYLTAGLAGLALALAALQAVVVLAHGGSGSAPVSAVRTETNRFSVPGGRAGIPYLPFDKAAPASTPEGRTPERQQEEKRTPPPPRHHGIPPRTGPQPARRSTA
jgi:hypothetical protein